MTDQHRALEVLDFWWSAGAAKWYNGGEEFDREIIDRFETLYREAADGGLDHWLDQPVSALALVIVLDQFPRNMYRATPKAFASDALALARAKSAIELGYDGAFPMPHKCFFYLPFMHCENLEDQQRGIDLNRIAGADEGYHYALIHMDVVCRFGRFPHRNDILGRTSTAAELAYLKTGGFSA
jgi:uncharacterized protein (DUF924 family)